MSNPELSATFKELSVRPRRTIHQTAFYPATEARIGTRQESNTDMPTEETAAGLLATPRVERTRDNHAAPANINIRSVADTIPYFKGNLTEKDIQFGDVSNPITLTIWLNALEAYFKAEGITSDRDKKSRLIHYVDRRHGDAHSTIARYLRPEFADTPYEKLVTELRRIYRSVDTGTFYDTVRMANNIQLGTKKSSIPINITSMEEAACQMVTAYKDRSKYKHASDARRMEDILFEFAYFQLMCTHLKPQVFEYFINLKTETSDPKDLCSDLGQLMHDSPQRFNESLVISPRVEKVSFAQDARASRDQTPSRNSRNEQRYYRSNSPAPNRSLSRTRDKSQERCYSCNKQGHYSSECRSNRGQNRSQSRDRYNNNRGNNNNNYNQNRRGQGNSRRGGKRQ